MTKISLTNHQKKAHSYPQSKPIAIDKSSHDVQNNQQIKSSSVPEKPHPSANKENDTKTNAIKDDDNLVESDIDYYKCDICFKPFKSKHYISKHKQMEHQELFSPFLSSVMSEISSTADQSEDASSPRYKVSLYFSPVLKKLISHSFSGLFFNCRFCLRLY